MAEVLEAYGIYKYSPLPSKRHIRLLELFAREQNNTVECALHFAQIDSTPHYEAISYAWGNDLNRVHVSCDGRSLMITSSLRDALQRFRLKDKSRMLWADAICIDQTNLLERSSQVCLMKNIYDNASRVCIWLGLANAHTPLAIEFIHELVRQDHSGNNIGHSRRDIEKYVSISRDLLPKPTSKCWHSLGILFSAAWFDRMWVIQEVNGHVCMVFNGDFEIKWSCVVVAAELLLVLGRVGFFNDIPHPSLGNYINTIQMNSTTVYHGSTSGLFDMFRNFCCSDERDKVYALMSFPPLNEIHPPILPNYNKSVLEVFEEATVRCSTYYQSLSLLSCIDHGSSIEEGWLSWVPRWDRGRDIQILHNYSSGREHLSTVQIKFLPGVLIAKGIRISLVSDCSEVVTMSMLDLKPIESRPHPLAALFENWQAQVPPNLTQIADDHYLDYLSMTLTVGLDAESHCPPDDMAQYRRDFLAYTQKAMSMLGTTRYLIDIQAPFIKEAAKGDEWFFCDAARRGSKNKRFIWTRKGELGVGPKAAQEGDIIVLLYGANAPCILRPRGAYYQFVGECYLHKHMHGEPIEMVRKGLLVAEDFVLM